MTGPCGKWEGPDVGSVVHPEVSLLEDTSVRFFRPLKKKSSHMPCVELWADAVIPRLHTEPISMKSDNTVRKSTVLFSLQCLLQIKYQEQTL